MKVKETVLILVTSASLLYVGKFLFEKSPARVARSVGRAKKISVPSALPSNSSRQPATVTMVQSPPPQNYKAMLSLLKGYIQAHLKSGFVPKSFDDYDKEYLERLHQMTEQESADPDLHEKLCKENIQMACLFYLGSLQDKFQRETIKIFNETKDEKIWEKRSGESAEIRFHAAMTCMKSGLGCAAALEGLRGTETGQLLENLTEDYCHAGNSTSCSSLMYSYLWEPTEPDSYCANRPDCVPPTENQQERKLNRSREIAVSGCSPETPTYCEKVVESLKFSPDDPVVQKSKEVLTESCAAGKDPWTCEISAIWKAQEGDFQSAKDIASFACQSGNGQGCLQSMKLVYEQTNDYEKLRPALERFCYSADMLQTTDNLNLCRNLASGVPLDPSFLDRNYFVSPVRGIGSTQSLRHFLEAAW